MPRNDRECRSEYITPGITKFSLRIQDMGSTLKWDSTVCVVHIRKPYMLLDPCRF